MRKDLNSRIFTTCLVCVIGTYLLLPFENQWVKLGVLCVAAILYLVVIMHISRQKTVDWTQNGKLTTVFWDKDEDVLWIMRRTVATPMEELGFSRELLEVCYMEGLKKKRSVYYMMDAISFNRDSSKVLNGKDGCMIIKQDNLRLKIQSSEVVERFFVA